MTLCIGALAQHAGNPRIVLCFDSKISADEFASETEYKYHRLDGRLVSLFSGAPGRAKELAWIYREFLRTATLDKQRIVEQLREPIKTFKRRLANAYLGRTLGLSYDDFLTRGVRSFGKDFQHRLTLIDEHPLRVDLIIAGFLGQFPVLCELRNGELELRTNYSMVGTGTYTAEPALHARKQDEMTTLYSAMYNVYEAKKLGEASPHVGTFTTMLVLSPSDTASESMHLDVVLPEGLNYLDSLYAQYGPKPLPVQHTFLADGLIRAQ